MLVNRQVALQRYQTCKTCDHFSPLLKMCKKCGCIIPMKVTLGISRCPIGKWGQEKIDNTETKEYKIED